MAGGKRSVGTRPGASREEAVELARQLAREEGAEFVIVHSLDGQVETTISIGR